MMIDLATLYVLIIGTLLVSAGLTLWESLGRSRRAGVLGIWATGWTTFALGCGIVLLRDRFAGSVGWALSNVVIVCSYLLVLHGVAALRARRYTRLSVLMVVLLAVGWTVAGRDGRDVFWHHMAGVPIVIASALTAFELARNAALRGLRSRPVAVLLLAAHALFYAARVLALPLLVAHRGGDTLALASQVTMYEGVLYSVAVPMTLLMLVREEAQHHLLAASRTDFLTGLSNRQGFFESGARLLRATPPEAARGATAATTLLAFDLDHFKLVNDRHGHAAGDAVLCSFAAVARAAVGPQVLLARLGGEEFAALLPGVDRVTARALGETIAQRFAARDVHGDGVTLSATVSIGLAQFGVDGDDLDALLSAADRALYVAKALGRNRLVSASPLFNGAAAPPATVASPAARSRRVA